MTSKRKPIPQMTKFGIANFPTPDDVAKQQKELLQKLKSSCVSSEGWCVQQEANLPGQESGAP